MGYFRSKEANGFAELMAITDADNPASTTKKLNLKVCFTSISNE